MNVEKLTMMEHDKYSEVSVVHQFSVRDTYPLHTHDFYELFLISKGNAIHEINGQSKVLTKGSYVLIRPFDVHSYDFFNHYDFEIITVAFSVETMEKICDLLYIDINIIINARMPLTVVLNGYNFTDVERKLCKIEKKDKGIQRRNYFLSILPYLLYRFVADSKSNPENDNILPRWLRNLIIEMNDTENFVAGLERLIELSHISQEHLTREFRKYLDVTPTEFINIKRMGYAAELLLKGEYEIIQICFMCGFNNLSHFYHVFKKQYNCSPKQFVKQNR